MIVIGWRQPSSRGGTVRLGVSGQLLSRTHSLSEIVDVLQSLDVDAIELWPRNVPGGEGPEEEQRYEKKDVAGTRRLLDERGMSVACVTLGFGMLKKCEEAGAGLRHRGAKGRGRCGGGARRANRQLLSGRASPQSSSWRRRSRRLSTRAAPG